jgi:hypothetical protein
MRGATTVLVILFAGFAHHAARGQDCQLAHLTVYVSEPCSVTIDGLRRTEVVYSHLFEWHNVKDAFPVKLVATTKDGKHAEAVANVIPGHGVECKLTLRLPPRPMPLPPAPTGGHHHTVIVENETPSTTVVMESNWWKSGMFWFNIWAIVLACVLPWSFWRLRIAQCQRDHIDLYRRDVEMRDPRNARLRSSGEGNFVTNPHRH